MAKVFPESFPVLLENDPGRRAERVVYEALSRLDGKHRVFYSVPWHKTEKYGHPKDGEADFIVAHPDKGILVLEVKGGEIGYDAARDEWRSISAGGKVHRIKDPVKQTQRTKYWLRDDLLKLPAWGLNQVPLGYGVIFPDTVIGGGDIKSDLPRALVLDHRDLEEVEESIAGMFAHYGKGLGEPLGHNNIRVLQSRLASSFKLTTPLGVKVDADAEQLIELTEAQAAMLGFLGDRKRAVIKGCAGSGKTMLALEQARRFRDQGLSVLLTCFNEPLAEFLGRRAGDGIEVLNFHGLCESVAKEAGVAPSFADSDPREYYSRLLPEAALQAAGMIDRRYDAIIVDEAQDLEDDWWIVIEAFLSESDTEARLFVFRDDNQNLYLGRHRSSVPVDEAPFSLPQNCRNTAAIHEFISRFHKHPENMKTKAPEGSRVELISCSTEAQHVQEVRKVLHKVVVDGKVDPADVVVLTPRAQRRSNLKVGEKLGNFTLVEGRPSSALEIQISTIHRFKGLDRKVAIVAEIDSKVGPHPKALLYVGCSRAQAKLFVVFTGDGETAVSDIVKELLV